ATRLELVTSTLARSRSTNRIMPAWVVFDSNEVIAEEILNLERATRQPLHTQRLDSTEVFRTPLCLTD
ncbi:hypothetical protein, partial [uncultured Pseudomonas sp.]|uniref:hypothetical protein n=1 Tax=uncultured Pseudomonas sp. TaxID=114707 RepID=UPI0025FDFE49